MHPILQRAQEESQAIYRRAQAEMESLRDIERARLMGGEPARQPASKPASPPAPRPNVAASPVPTPAEIDARTRASFARLSASDQAVLLRFGAAPAGVTVSTPIARPQPAQSAYDVGAFEAARLLGRPAPAPLGEIALASREPEPDPRFDAAQMKTGAAEAQRLLGKAA
jgi:hypothetical protein